MNEHLNMPPHLTLETARTREEHNEIFKSFGVLWWWKLLDDPLWTNGSAWETVGQEDIGHHHSAFSAPQGNRRRLLIWSLPDVFKDRYERSAFLYEMKARIGGRFEKYEFDKPWSELTKEQWDALANRWPMEPRRPFWTVQRPEIEPKAGWTNLQNTSWNLSYDNATLVREFKARLNLAREQLGKQRKAIRRTKERSWRPIQLIDQRQFEGRVLTDGDRSQVSKAIRDASI